jgi:hypothetical protein
LKLEFKLGQEKKEGDWHDSSKTDDGDSHQGKKGTRPKIPSESPPGKREKGRMTNPAMKLLNRLSLKRPPSVEKLHELAVSSQHDLRTAPRRTKLTSMVRSTSMPIIETEAEHVAIDVAPGDDESSVSSTFRLASEDGLIV